MSRGGNYRSVVELASDQDFHIFDSAQSRPLRRLRLRGLQHSPGNAWVCTWAARWGGLGGELAINSLDWSQAKSKTPLSGRRSCPGSRERGTF